jgi:hypothetical protein
MKNFTMSCVRSPILLIGLFCFIVSISESQTVRDMNTFRKDTSKYKPKPATVNANKGEVKQNRNKDPKAGKEKQQTPTVSRAEVQKWFVYENKTHPGKTKHKAVAPDGTYLEIYPYDNGFLLNQSNKRKWTLDSPEARELGTNKFSEDAVVEYGGLRKWRNGDLCHIFYLWDIGMKGFVVYGTPLDISNANTYVTKLPFSEPIKPDYKYFLFIKPDDEYPGIALIPSSNPKNIGFFFLKNGESLSGAYSFADAFQENNVASFKNAKIGFSRQDEDIILKSDESSLIIAFSLRQNTIGTAFIAAR